MGIISTTSTIYDSMKYNRIKRIFSHKNFRLVLCMCLYCLSSRVTSAMSVMRVVHGFPSRFIVEWTIRSKPQSKYIFFFSKQSICRLKNLYWISEFDSLTRHMASWNLDNSDPVMLCGLFGAKPLPKPRLTYQLDTTERISLNFLRHSDITFK